MMVDYGSFFGSIYAEGAKTTTTGKPLHDGNIDFHATSFPREIRKQTHYLNVNGTDIPSIVRTNTNKTIGVSVSIQVESKSKVFNKEAEKYIDGFLKKGGGELTNKHHFNKTARIWSDFDLIDGGFMIRHHYNYDKFESGEWKFPYRYENVGVDMIDVSKTQRTFDENRKQTTINGLVRNEWGQITHIWLYNNENKRKSTKVPYDDIIYYSDTWISIDQQTAVSKLTSMLRTLDMSLQYGTAELNSAIEAAKAGHYLKSQAYNEVMTVVSEAIKAQVPNASDAKDIAKVIDLVKPVMRQLANLGVKPHGVTPIASGDEVQFDTSKSDSQYKTLNDNTEMKMASSIGYSDIGTYKKASDANYSSIKATIEMDQITADVKFDDIKNIVIDDILSRAVVVGIQIGEISQRVAYFKKPSDFNKFRCLRQNKIDIEPAKNATANKINIAQGIDTQANIVETKYGIKYEKWVEKDIEQQELKADADLALEIRLLDKRQKAFEKAELEDPQVVETEIVSDKTPSKETE